MYIYYNPNPRGASRSGDCVVRALAKATGETWEEVYWELALLGYEIGDMPSINNTWAEFLLDKGFKRRNLEDTCPRCYTVRDFSNDNPEGVFVLGMGSHVVTVEDGNYYDAWDSGDEIPIYFFH